MRAPVGLTKQERESLMGACPVAITPTVDDHADLFNAVAAIIATRRNEFHAMHLGVLAQARREAWDEGHRAAYLFERGEVYPEPSNPYRIDTT